MRTTSQAVAFAKFCHEQYTEISLVRILLDGGKDAVLENSSHSPRNLSGGLLRITERSSDESGHSTAYTLRLNKGSYRSNRCMGCMCDVYLICGGLNRSVSSRIADYIQRWTVPLSVLQGPCPVSYIGIFITSRLTLYEQRVCTELAIISSGNSLVRRVS